MGAVIEPRGRTLEGYLQSSLFTDYSVLVAQDAVTGVKASGVISVTGIPLAKVDNVYAQGWMDLSANPLAKVDNVNAYGTLTVSGVPLAAVENVNAHAHISVDGLLTYEVVGVNASATLTVSGTPALTDTITVGTQQFVFVESGTDLGNIVQSAVPGTQATNIATAINRDLTTVTAVAVGNVVTITADQEGTEGANGNSIALFASGTAVTESHDHLVGGVTAVVGDTLSIGTDNFKVVLSGATAGEINYAATATEQAHNIVVAINRDCTAVTADHLNNIVTVTVVAPGEGGNGIPLVAVATNLTADALTAGGVNFVLEEAFHVDGQKFTFVTSGTALGNVVIGSDATETAHNIVVSLTRDLATVTATHLLGVVTITSFSPGEAGNQIALTTESSNVTVSAATLEHGVNAVAEESFTLDNQKFTFKESGTSTGDVIVGVTTGHTIANIVTSINRDLATVVASEGDPHDITLVAVAAGVAGDAITLTKDSAKLTINGAHFTGGVDAVAEQTFSVDGHAFTFVTTRSRAGEVTIGSTAAIQAGLIRDALRLDLTSVTASRVNATCVITAATEGVAGNGILLSENSPVLTVSHAHLEGGVDAVDQPEALNLPTNTLLGRLSGNIDALTVSEVFEMLGIADYVSANAQGLIWQPSIVAANVIADATPSTTVHGDVYLLTESYLTFVAGDLIQYQTDAWVKIKSTAIGDHFGVSLTSSTAAAGSFAGKADYLAVITGGTAAAWTFSFTAPVANMAVKINTPSLLYAHTFNYSDTLSQWIDISGGIEYVFSTGLTDLNNTIAVDVPTVKTALNLVKADVGLGNVNNTSDANKPVSTAQQNALDLKAPLADPTFTGTVSGISAAMVGAVAKNNAITGATKTKITYDAKGLVTSGADATTADIAASSDKNYVTDAQLVVISNTSGTNTGDKTLAQLGGVAANSNISGATKTKITYDAKGLVTSGADATTADIADSLNKRYVTDAEKNDVGKVAAIATHILSDGSLNITLGTYLYHAASPTVDTIGDWRQYANTTTIFTQVCTAGNATKGGGTWVTKETTIA